MLILVKQVSKASKEAQLVMAWSWVRRDTGGSTPKPSHVSRMMLFGWPLTAGSLALGMYCRMQDARSKQSEVSSKQSVVSRQ